MGLKKMTIPDIEEGVNRCLENAKSLLKDAQLLLDNGSHGHAMFFAVSAVEETSKAFMYAVDMRRGITNHHPKLNLFISYLIAAAMEEVFKKRRQRIFHPTIPEKPLNIDDYVEMAQDTTRAKDVLYTEKLEALYVDNRDENWTSPSDIRKEDVEVLIKHAENYVRATDFQTRNILKAPEELSEEYQNWLQNGLTPFAKKYLKNHLEEFYNEKIISKETYDRLSGR